MNRLLPILMMTVPVVCFAADDFDRPALGMRMVPISAVREKLKDYKPVMPTRVGTLVTDVSANGPAAAIEITPLTIITKIGGKAVDDQASYEEMRTTLEVGKPVDIAGYKIIVTGVRRWKAFTAKITPAKHRDVAIQALDKKGNNILDSSKRLATIR